MERTNLQPSFLDHLTSHLGGKRTSALLGRVNEVIDWHAVAAPVRALPEYQAKASDPGRRPWEASLMVRCLFLAKCYNLSDPQLEEQLSDRMSFRRFVGLSLDDVTPDETSFVVFRNRLREAGLHDAVFYGVLGQIEGHGLLLKSGTMVDATILETSRGTKRKEANSGGEKGTSTRDPEATFTRKHGETYLGYKGHNATDLSKIVTGYSYTTASAHDSREFDELTADEDTMAMGDSAYSDRQRCADLEARGVLPAIIQKRVRGQKELSPWQKKFNKLVSKIRARVEHPFAWMSKVGFTRIRYRGLERNMVDYALVLTAWNVRRAVTLLR